MANVIFFQRRSKVTVKVTSPKFMVPLESLRRKEHTCQIKKNLSYSMKKLWPMLKFSFKSRSKVMVKVTSSKFMVPLERSCHKDHTYRI